MFDPQVEALADDYRVITWDERGFGQTEFDSQPFTLLGLGRRLPRPDRSPRHRAGGRRRHEPGRVPVAARRAARPRAGAGADPPRHRRRASRTRRRAEQYQRMARRCGSTTVRSTSSPTPSPTSSSPTRRRTQRWIAKWQARPKELIREPAACLFGRDDITDRLGEITCPALVVHGIDDTSIPMEAPRQLAAALPGAGGGGQGRRAPTPPTSPTPSRSTTAIVGFLAGLPRVTTLQVVGVEGLPEIDAGADLACADRTPPSSSPTATSWWSRRRSCRRPRVATVELADGHAVGVRRRVGGAVGQGPACRRARARRRPDGSCGWSGRC